MPDMTASPTPDPNTPINAPEGGYSQGVSNPPSDPPTTDNDPNAQQQQPTPAAPADNAPAQPAQGQPSQAQPTSNPAPTPAAGPQQQQQQQQAQPPQKPVPTGVSPNNPNATHPAVQKAGLFHTIAEALTGGPRYQATVDPNTGQITQTKVPMSNARLGMALALEAISGGMTGMSQVGPGSAARGGAIAFQQSQQEQQQQVQKNQQNQIRQQTAALHNNAQMVELNSRKILNTAQAEKLGLDSLKKAADINKDYLDQKREDGHLDGENISQDELLEGTKNGTIDGTKDTPVAMGVTNINGKWEQTFALVRNSNAKVSFTPDEVKAWKEAGVQGVDQYPSDAVNGGMMPGTMKDHFNQQMQANGQMKQEVSKIGDTLSSSDVPANQELAKSIPDFNKLLTDPQRGAGLQNALTKFQSYVSHSDMHGMDFYQSLQQMAQPSKPDPNNPKQFIPNGKAPLANTIAGAFGNGDPQKGWQVLKAYHDQLSMDAAREKNEQAMAGKPMTVAVANGVANDPKSTPEQKAQAEAVLQGDTNHARAKATATAEGKAAVKGTGDTENSVTGDPELDGLVTPANVGPDGFNNSYIQALQKKDGPRAALVDAIAHGQRLESLYGLAKKDGQILAAQVHAYDPSFNQNNVQAYNKMVTDMSPGGKTGIRLGAANTAQKHLANLVDNVTWMNSLGSKLPGSGNLHIKGMAAADVDKQGLSSEIAKFYKGGAPDKEAVEELHKVLTANNPNNVRDAAKELSKLLNGGVDTIYQQFKDKMPSDHVDIPAFYDPKGAAAYKHVTGEDVDPDLLGRKYRVSGAQTQAPQTQSNSGGTQQSQQVAPQPPKAAPPQGAVSTGKGSDGRMHYWNSAGKSLGIVQ